MMNEEMKASRELDAQVAECLFGWEWLERPTAPSGTRKALFAPLDSDWRRINFHAPEWSPAQSDTLRFHDWDQCCVRMIDSNREQRGLPHYSTSIADAWKVLREVVQRGLLRKANLDIAIFAMTEQLAAETICRLALKAVENHDE